MNDTTLALLLGQQRRKAIQHLTKIQDANMHFLHNAWLNDC